MEEHHPECGWRLVVVQHALLEILGDETSLVRQDKIVLKRAVFKSVSIIQQYSRHPDLSMDLIGAFTSNSYDMISEIRLNMKDFTDIHAIRCFDYLNEAKKIRETIGHQTGVVRSEATIAYFKLRCILRNLGL